MTAPTGAAPHLPRGHGRIFAALLGSISQYVAARAACPVVVITPVGPTTGRMAGR